MTPSLDGRSSELRVFAGAKEDGPVNDMWKYDLGICSEGVGVVHACFIEMCVCGV